MLFFPSDMIYCVEISRNTCKTNLDSLIKLQKRAIRTVCISLQDSYEDEVERSLIRPGGAYARPSSRAQANHREQERERQLLQEALSLYLASPQPSYRRRGSSTAATAAMAPAGDLELLPHGETLICAKCLIKIFIYFFHTMNRCALL